jgi:hypothetical protein
LAYIPVDYPDKICLHCKITFKPNRKDKKYCSSRCKVNAKNKRDPNRILKTRLYNRPYYIYKQSICYRCGFVPEHSCQLDVHHIDYNHKNNDIENLQTLCANCHRLKHI